MYQDKLMQSWKFTKKNLTFEIDRALMEEIRWFLRMFVQFKSQKHVQVKVWYNELIFVIYPISSSFTRIETKIRYTAGLLCYFIKIKLKKQISKYEILKQSMNICISILRPSLLMNQFLHLYPSK